MARYLRRKYLLSFPLDVLSFAKNHAEFYEDDIPGKIEGLLIRKDSTTRAKIVISRTLAPNRKTFTIAHELGHLFLPWHCGSFVCMDTESSVALSSENDIYYWALERSANAFASELLLPTDEVLAKFSQLNEDICALYAFTDEAKISKAAASIAFLKALPSGLLFYQTDWMGIVEKSGRTAGSPIGLEPNGTSISDIVANNPDALHFELNGANATYHWFSYRGRARGQTAASITAQSSAAILKQITLDLGVNKHDLQSLNGVIGSANNLASRDPSFDLYTIVRTRIKQHPTAKRFMDHVQFDYFLSARISELRKK